MTVHHHFYRGKRIYVIKRNGETLIGKYLDSKGKGIYLDTGYIPFNEIRSTGYNVKELNQKEKQNDTTRI